VEDNALPILHLVGYDNILWASDFPHPDGLWPESQAYIQTMFKDLDPDVRDKIVYRNVAGLFGLS
jgi:predicted TIM-barrel fold metal-dependent hydrolase